MNNHLEEVCQMGQGAKCCKFLTLGPEGFACAKTDPALYAGIIATWHLSPHVAQGDNCEGAQGSVLNKKR